MKSTLYQIIILLLIPFFSLAKDGKRPLLPKVGVCGEWIYYETKNRRIYVQKSVDSVIGKYLKTGEISFLGRCSYKSDLIQQDKPYYCGFEGYIARLDMIESKWYATDKSGILKIEILSNCYDRGNQNDVYLLILKKNRKGDYRFLSFEYSYSQL